MENRRNRANTSLRERDFLIWLSPPPTRSFASLCRVVSRCRCKSPVSFAPASRGHFTHLCYRVVRSLRSLSRSKVVPAVSPRHPLALSPKGTQRTLGPGDFPTRCEPALTLPVRSPWVVPAFAARVPHPPLRWEGPVTLSYGASGFAGSLPSVGCTITGLPDLPLRDGCGTRAAKAPPPPNPPLEGGGNLARSDPTSCDT